MKKTKKKAKSTAHPGFQAVARGIAKRQGISIDRADAELAAQTRRAGAAARRRNPNLNRVRGKNKAVYHQGKKIYG